MKKVSGLVLAVLTGIAAAVWIARAVVDVVYGVPEISRGIFLLDLLCAIVWIVAFLVYLFRYRAGKKG